MRRAHRALIGATTCGAIAVALGLALLEAAGPGDAGGADAARVTERIADGRPERATNPPRPSGAGPMARVAAARLAGAAGAPSSAALRATATPSGSRTPLPRASAPAAPPPAGSGGATAVETVAATADDAAIPAAPAGAAGRRGAGGPSLLWPRLDPPQPETDRLTVQVTGRDPVGDRVLWLYRIDDERAHRLGRTRSDAAGRFDFGHVPVPDAGLALVATAADADPLDATPVRVEAPPQRFRPGAAVR